MGHLDVTSRGLRFLLTAARLERPVGARPVASVLAGSVLAGSVLAVVLLADGARERGDLSALDPSVTSDVVAVRSPVLTVLAQAFTFLAGEAGIAAMTVVLLAWVVRRRADPRLAVLLAAGMGLSVTLTVVLKHVIARSRPPAGVVLGRVDTGFAFPSGHTLNATVFFGLLAGLAFIRLRRRSARVAVVLTWLAAAGAVGLSRLYLGYHWMTDVLAGWAVGAGVLALTALVGLALADRGPVTGGFAGRPSVRRAIGVDR